jgi:hypothetical protein
MIAGFEAITAAEYDISHYFVDSQNEWLRDGPNIKFIADVICRGTNAFQLKAESLFPHALEYSESEKGKYRASIQYAFQECYDRMFRLRLKWIIWLSS